MYLYNSMIELLSMDISMEEVVLNRLINALAIVWPKDRGRNTEICRRTGYSPGQVSGVLNKKVALDSKFIKSVCREFSINEDWVVTGEGESVCPKGIADIDFPAGPSTKISERLTGYSDDIKMIADSIEIQVQGKTAAERSEFVKGVMAAIWGKGK